jgi:hypothetical protein
MAMILDGSNGVTFNDASLQGAAASPFGLKNRIINGDMVIDQRAAGASSTAGNGTYTTCDRWNTYSTQASKFTVQQNAGSVTPPAGFTNYLGVTSSSAYSVTSTDTFSVNQFIEGYNVADLAWGTANARTVTLSFWVRSSLTGTFGGNIINVNGNRSYPFSYTISSANTWEQKTVTIAGDTTGTWNKTNVNGMGILFGLGSGSTYSGTSGTWQAGNLVQPTGTISVVGTSGATWFLTGVQLERNTTATPFEWLPYGTELALCQRYFETSFNVGTAPANNSANTINYPSSQFNSTTAYTGTTLKVSKRTSPTVTIYSSNAGTSTANQVQYFNNAGSGWTNGTSSSGGAATDNSIYFIWTTSGTTAGYSYWTQFGWTASAEL